MTFTLNQIQQFAAQETRYNFAASGDREAIIRSCPKAQAIQAQIDELQVEKRGLKTSAENYRRLNHQMQTSFYCQYAARDADKARQIDFQIHDLNTEIMAIGTALKAKVRRF